MATITEDYCSKEIYRLLIEKGFDGEIHTTFDKEGYTQASITLQIAMKWLREVYKISIEITSKGYLIDKDVEWECDIKAGHRLYFKHITNEKSFESKDEEKQGEQKFADTDDKFIRMRETKPKDISEFLDRLTTVEQEFLWEHIAKIRELDKEEQKLTEKVEPKFHEGEWVVYECGEETATLQITRIVGETYVFSDDSTLSVVDEDALRLWDITKDAKDGDVLFYRGNVKYSDGIKYERICLFNNLNNAFFTLTKTSNSVEEYDIDVNIDYPYNTVPATKEQKEILFMVIKEAGYEWSDKDRKLIKIIK